MPTEDDLEFDTEHRAEAEASLERIHRILASAGRLDHELRRQLIGATKELEHALGPVYEREAAHARSVTHFAEALAHEATKPAPSRDLIGIGIEGLNAAARPIEGIEPRLVPIIGRIADALAQLGI